MEEEKMKIDDIHHIKNSILNEFEKKVKKLVEEIVKVTVLEAKKYNMKFLEEYTYSGKGISREFSVLFTLITYELGEDIKKEIASEVAKICRNEEKGK